MHRRSDFLLGHNLLFTVASSLIAAIVARTAGATTAACVIAVHLHILGDLAGSRGPDGYRWRSPC
ncbi:MAG TPA: hypothetical protein VNA69_11665 [Thermoanaerobaculia bacterium]|nr:hypothetical protein [Thermoanaerobaculia bacterium]